MTSQDAIDDEGQPMSADDIREGYNTAILETALSYQSANAEDGEADEEMDAQIEIVRTAWAAGDTARTDGAVDHLRVVLEISYLDNEEGELPTAPAARGVAAIPAGAPDEVFEVRCQLTRAQILAIYPGLKALAEYPNNRADERAAEILLGAIPPAALGN